MQSHLRKMVFFLIFHLTFKCMFCFVLFFYEYNVRPVSVCDFPVLVSIKRCCALLFIPMQFNSINLAKSLFIVLKEEFSNIHAIVGAFVKNASTVFLFRLHYSCTRLAAFHEVQNNGTNNKIR